MQGRALLVVFRLDVGSSLNQPLGDLQVPIEGRVKQRREACFIDGVHGGACIDALFHDLQVPSADSRTQLSDVRVIRRRARCTPQGHLKSVARAETVRHYCPHLYAVGRLELEFLPAIDALGDDDLEPRRRRRNDDLEFVAREFILWDRHSHASPIGRVELHQLARLHALRNFEHHYLTVLVLHLVQRHLKLGTSLLTLRYGHLHHGAVRRLELDELAW
mmetsp:Transcript_95089/g.268589  ORF Transcript_95089/g.268589 Transcript_95089/m.268589 type:complete len:219 (+) Transcript_95089:303-959(+)